MSSCLNRCVVEVLGGCRMVFGDPQTCVYPDVCLGIGHASGKAPFLGQGVWQIHNVSAPSPQGICREKGADTLCIYQAPCPERETLPDTWTIPKHTSGKHRSGGPRGIWYTACQISCMHQTVDRWNTPWLKCALFLERYGQALTYSNTRQRNFHNCHRLPL